MFYSQFILAKKGPLGTIWIAAHLERKLRKNQVTDTDIGVSVDSIIFPEVPIALRLSSHLMVGVVRIYSRKVNYLFHDCSEALLKIKQAFRSAAVDLPPEESTAPYHSITLPETFHLDDFELPEAEFQGDIDHHVSSKEQITLQDNPERTGYSTSEFGLDERFGDGSSSHMGFDLEEELLLAKDDPIQLESGDGILIQGQSSLHPTDMDVDDNPSKDEEAEAYNKMDDEPSSSSKQNQSNADDLRNNIPNWTGYNLRTPDLNDMLFHNEGDAGPSSSYYQPSPFPCDDPASPASPASPEFVSAQAPATPGLMEETVPSRVHESPVLSPQRKASPSSNEETAKSAAHANDAVGAGMAEFRLAEPVQVESSGAVREMDFLRQHSATVDMPPEPQTSKATVDKLVVNTEDIAVSGKTLPFKATMGSVPFVQNTSEPRTNGSTETYVTGNQTHFNEGSVNMLQEIPPGMTHSNISTAAFQQNTGTIPQYMSYNDRPNDMFTSNFPERERMLSAPYIGFHQTNDLGQLTAEKGITESDGSNKIGSLSSRKRHLEDSMPAPESRTTENLSSTPDGQRTTDAIPNDDDILASILVGRRTPGLVLDSTPLPPNASTSKRQRLTPKTALTPKTRTPKRRVKMDDAMVIHADIIRQQLISTEDIRRIRRKAPCTRTEIWMIEKGSLEDDIFREPIFSCMHKDLNGLHYRTYESVSQFTVHNREPQGQVDMSETIRADYSNAGISGAEESLDHQLHMGLPDGAQLDATPQEATDAVDATAAFGLQMPSDERDNNIEKVTEFGDGKEIPLVDETNAAANITAHVDTLDKDCHQDASADMQRNTNADTPLFVQDDITHDSATITDAPDVALHSSGPACAQAVDAREGELSDIVRSDINTFEDKEMPTSEVTGLEFTEHASGFPQPTEDENAVSAMGENSGLQGNNAGSFTDMDNMGHDFTDMDHTDFGSAIHGVDADFLPYDDDGDFDEAIDLDDDDDEPNPDEFQSHDALSGWSSRTKGVARYLKTLFDEESGRGRKNVVIDHLVNGKSRKEASRMFFETLVLSTKDYIQVEQPIPFGLINVKPVSKLLKTDF
ncbi:unnamed protein product [Triticum turgidum subsp. durum]|uniref:Sister chromatid cohesion 1 protein 4 n=1 Tax=Triticum turgidum subsp. durum TaxID=4567 RepID=A0A9R0VPT0_TRITD|nr:unnamed protein product [Triticum turgidum subsp. durum]